MLKILYFAWLRERIGTPSEQIESESETVGALIEELASRDERYALAFSDLGSIRVAVDQELADFDAPISDASEIAFFPPMTGG